MTDLKDPMLESIPPVVAVLLWKAFYNPGENGLFNTMLGWVSLGPLAWLAVVPLLAAACTIPLPEHAPAQPT